MRNLAIALLLAGSTGCSMFNSVMYGAEDSAGRGVGNAIGNSVASNATNGASNAQPASYNGGGGSSSSGGAGMSSAMMANPAIMNMYMSVIFTYAFGSGGYDVAPAAYKPGEYTRWSGKSQDGKGIVLERAYLMDDGKGRQWWKVKWTDDSNKTLILEGLLDPAQKRFVRMRAKFPDDAEGKEMPVDEATYYHPPQKLSPESVEGATKGVENVSVPAGSFNAKHVVFGGMDGSHEWWLDSKVPGGTVKQLVVGGHGGNQWQMELQAFGGDAKTELGSK